MDQFDDRKSAWHRHAISTPAVRRPRDRMKAGETGSEGLSSTNACDGSGKDLHGHADDPSQHDHCGPKDVRILTDHNHTDGCKSRQRREKCADGAEKLRSVDLSGTAF